MKCNFLIAILLLLSQSSYSQILKGKVVDKNGLPLEFVNAVLMEDSAYVAGSITNADGVFKIAHPYHKNYHVEISMIGYETRSLSIPETDDCGTITLKEAQISLGEAVVKAYKPIFRQDDGTLVTTIENTALAKMGTAADVLSKLPLVKEENGEFSVFGKGTPLIYINGRLVRNTNDLQQLSSEDIRSVEVNTNPGVRYSAEAQSVIRIKTIPPQGEGFGMDLYNVTQASHFVQNTSDMSFNYRHNGLDVFAEWYYGFGKRYYRDESTMDSYREDLLSQSINTRSAQRFSNLFGEIGFNYQISEDHSLGAYYSLERDDRKTHAHPASQISLYQSDKLVSSESILSNWVSRSISMPMHAVNFYYNGTVGKLSIDFNADYTQSHSGTNDTHDESNLTSGENRFVTSDGLKRSRLMAEKLVLTYPVWKGTFEIGEEYTNSRLNYRYDYSGLDIYGTNNKIKEDNIAIFANLSQRLAFLDLAAGVRYEHVIYKYLENGVMSPDLSRNYDNVFPALSLGAALGEVRLSLSFTCGTTRPSYQQLDGSIRYVNNFVYQCGNPKLQPVKRYTLQLSSAWKWLYAQASVNRDKDAIFWNTTPYRDDASVNMLSFVNVPSFTQAQFVLGARPTIGCWEPQATISMIKQFFSEEYDGGMPHPGRPLYSFELDNAFSLPKGWTLSADFHYTTKGSSQNSTLSSTNQIDLMVSKSLFKGNLVIAFYVNDLLDDSATHTTLYSNGIVTGMLNKAEQRNVNLTIRYKFNAANSKYKGTGAGEAEKIRM